MKYSENVKYSRLSFALLFLAYFLCSFTLTALPNKLDWVRLSSPEQKLMESLVN
jgi:glycopeptide antibiotics resistance protein